MSGRFKDLTGVQLTGFIARVELAELNSGRKVLNITVGSNQSSNSDEDIAYRKVEVWENPEAIKWLTPGSEVVIMGELRQTKSSNPEDKRTYDKIISVPGQIRVTSKFKKDKPSDELFPKK